MNIKSLDTVMPDYENSILNFISSVLTVFDVDVSYKTLPFLDLKRLSEKKNIVVIILDGMGYNLFSKLETRVNGSSVHKIMSVFPPTTATAITTIMSAESPLEHGVVGWSLFFKEFGKLIDVLPKTESSTGESLSDAYDATELLGIKNIFRKIAESSPDVNLVKITPEYISKSDFSLATSLPAKMVPYADIEDMFANIESEVKNKTDRKFIVAYSVNPDGLEHLNGVYAERVMVFMRDVIKKINNLTDSLKDEDVTIFITADHGLTDVRRHIRIDEDKELFDTILLPPFPESRFVSFFVKRGKIDDFNRAMAKYKSDFIVMSREEFFEGGYLGYGKPHRLIDDFIGDYVAIAKSSSIFRMGYRQNIKKGIEFKAHHAGLTADEMYVPLIEIDL